MHKNQIGKLYIPKGAIPKQHEVCVAELLIRTGHSVCFVEVGLHKTPDIYFLHKYWEIKSPTGKSSRTIEKNIRAALTQSKNIIIDLQRTTISDAKTKQYIIHHIQNFHGLKELLLITHDQKIFKITSKGTCFTKITVLQ